MTSPSFYTNVAVRGDNILLRAIENGQRIQRKIPFRPIMYVPVENDEALPDNNKVSLTSIHGEPLRPIQFDTIRAMRDFVSQYEDVDGFRMFGYAKPVYQYISQAYSEEIVWDFSLIRRFNMDIEVDSAGGFSTVEDVSQPITSITIWDSDTKKFQVWALNLGGYRVHRPDVVFQNFDSEPALLLAMLGYWRSNYPDILTGWNVRFYDVAYLINRMVKLLGERVTAGLSPWGQISTKSIRLKGKDHTTYDISGISIMDGQELIKKYTFTDYESYSLNNIAHVLLDKKKVKYNISLANLYRTDPQKFVEYNVQDVALVNEIDDKKNFIELVLGMAYMAKVNYNDVYGPVKLWTVMTMNHMSSKNQVIDHSSGSHVTKTEKYEGAYVMEPTPGAYDWVQSFDVQSLYPRTMQALNISPETIIHEPNEELARITSNVSVEKLLEDNDRDTARQAILQKHNMAMAVNGAFFSRDKRGIFYEMIEMLFQKRIDAKNLQKKHEILARDETDPAKKEHHNMLASRYKVHQNAMKILLNSLYGGIGNPHFLYYDVKCAEAITITCQFIIRHIEKHLNIFMNNTLGTKDVRYIIYADTDSNFMMMKDLVDKAFANKSPRKAEIVDFLNKVAQLVIAPFLDEQFKNICKKLNAYDNQFLMVRDKIAERGIWRGKKNYILLVHDEEGTRFNPPEMKVVGIECVKSSTPEICRTKIKEALQIIMTKGNQELLDFLEAFKKDYMNLPPEEIACPRTLNDMEKWELANGSWKQGTPIHVKAAILFNKLLAESNLQQTVHSISPGDKVRFVYLKQPNPTRSSAIAMHEYLPPELGMHAYIDHETQWKKTFLAPIQSIADIVNWKTKHESTIDLFFA